MKDTLLRDGATTVDAVPMTFRHKDGCAVTVFGDDFSAAGSRQGSDSLNHAMEHNFRARALAVLLAKLQPKQWQVLPQVGGVRWCMVEGRRQARPGMHRGARSINSRHCDS